MADGSAEVIFWRWVLSRAMVQALGMSLLASKAACKPSDVCKHFQPMTLKCTLERIMVSLPYGV